MIFAIISAASGEWHVLSSAIFSRKKKYSAIPIIETDKTLADIPGKRFDPALKVYILTSEHTGSAAEGFIYILKNYNLATIVGETTIGMAHPSEEIVLSKKFRMSVPYIKVINPVTNTNFENIGVIPHIEVPASKALDAALKDIKKRKDKRGEVM